MTQTRRIPRKFPLLGFLLLFLAPAPEAGAIVIRHDRPDSQYTDLANQPQFAAMGSNAILIAPDWAVTAAHVGATGISIGGSFYPASSIINHPSWNGDVSQGYDIKLLQLQNPVIGITPALLYGGNQELGLQATYVGYGLTGNGLTGALANSGGTRRAGQNILDAFGVNDGQPNSIEASLIDGPILLADFDAPGDPSKSTLGGTQPVDLEGMLAGGDSGGGVFVQVNGLWMLVGINSFIANANGDGSSTNYGDWLGITRISTYSDWIFQETGIAAVPEPLTVLGAGTAAGFGTFFKWVLKRRKKG